MPAPPDPLNDEDLLGLDVPDILHALLAPMESPASYQQQGHGPYAPLPQILHAPIPNARLMWTMRAWVT